MNFYQSVFPETKFFKNIRKKAGFRVVTLQYLPFLVRAMPAFFSVYTIYATNLWSCKKDFDFGNFLLLKRHAHDFKDIG